MRYIALRLAYSGTNYHGWQAQKELPTVSGTLERALSEICGEQVRVTGCGRTDAGVHAKTYVANFRTGSQLPVDRLPYAVNSRLPEDIAVYDAAEVEEDFHAVFSAVKKEYTYYIYPSRLKNPFYARRAYFYPGKIDLEAMRSAAAQMTGTHDFSAFRSAGSNVKTTVRTVYYFDCAAEGELIALKICANGFLYNMARSMAGTAIYASEGKILPERIPDIFDAAQRKNAGPTLPPHGLFMTGVWYKTPVFKR
ncbi:MAG: tRNA pseudouridine(38-40) synthase TruA [Oscillospiraceae bacterium]|jgi:tRNA pseudouridine38-40 synthase|nr:tRNA pseudouridine(38-40) synthase TruA [Oscillospiraceae bacterium]